MTKPQPVALGFTEGMTPLDELRQRVKARHHDYAIMLCGGAISRKTIRFKTKRWEITNHIDGSRQRLTDEELWTASNIGQALDKRALLDMSGDPILNVEDRGPVLASTLTEEARDKAAEYREQRARERAEDPLHFVLSDGPGAIRLPTPDPEEAEWEPADTILDLHVCDIGPATVAEIDLGGKPFDAPAGADASIELTIEDIDALIETLTAIRQDAVANRNFALREDGFWTNGRE